jgi:hypothetical protein
MEDLKNNKMLWILIGVTIFNIGAFIAGKIVIDKAADRVIQKLQKDYSPSPYGPGFDPDKVSPEGFKASKSYLEQRDEINFEPQPLAQPNLQTHGGNISNSMNIADAWRSGWEQDRGFNPAQ